MENIKIELNIKEIEILGKALSNMPYYMVAELLHNIQNQVNQQIKK